MLYSQVKIRKSNFCWWVDPEKVLKKIDEKRMRHQKEFQPCRINLHSSLLLPASTTKNKAKKNTKPALTTAGCIMYRREQRMDTPNVAETSQLYTTLSIDNIGY